MRIDAKGMHYRQLNKMIRDAVASGEKEFELDNIGGQRYIGVGLDDSMEIIINGTPGNDLGAFMNGPKIIVNANAQEGISNTMNAGEIIVHGNVGDIIGYGMRGGKLYIKGDAGYRVGIHMKEYKKQIPVIVAGGTAGDFFGEYMAGGIMILLGMNGKRPIVGAGSSRNLCRCRIGRMGICTCIKSNLLFACTFDCGDRQVPNTASFSGTWLKTIRCGRGRYYCT